MSFEVISVSRGDIRLQKDDKHVRVLGEALISTTLTEPGYVIYLDSLLAWEAAPEVALTENEKQEVVSAIEKHFHDHGSVVEFE